MKFSLCLTFVLLFFGICVTAQKDYPSEVELLANRNFIKVDGEKIKFVDFEDQFKQNGESYNHFINARKSRTKLKVGAIVAASSILVGSGIAAYSFRQTDSAGIYSAIAGGGIALIGGFGGLIATLVYWHEARFYVRKTVQSFNNRLDDNDLRIGFSKEGLGLILYF